jgi:hypothetical protein
LQYQASQDALNFQKQQYGQQQQNLAPWLQSGQAGLGQLDYMLGLGSPSAYAGSGTLGVDRPSTGSTLTSGNPNAMAVASNGNNVNSLQNANFTGGNGTPTANPIMGNSGINGIRPMAPTGNGARSATIPQSGAMPSSTPMSGALPSAGVNPSLGGFGSLMQSYPGGQFQAPTGLTEQNDPGYQARLQLGQDTMERSAAARGGVLTGGTAQAENQAAQDYASNEYGNTYNRALNSYDTNFNTWNTNQTNQYNRLASLAGLGQQTATQLGQLGQNASNNVSSNLLSTAQNMGQAYQNAGAANASGYVGAANAWGGALQSGSSNLSNLLMLQQLGGSGSSSSFGDNGGY